MFAYSDVDDLLQVPGDKNAWLQIHLGLCYACYARNVGDFWHCRHEQILSSKDTSIFFFFFFLNEVYYIQFICYIRNSVGGGSQLITSFWCSCLFLIGCSRTFSFLHRLALSLSLYATRQPLKTALNVRMTVIFTSTPGRVNFLRLYTT